MLNAMVELFMSEYFLMRAVLGKNLEDGEGLFRTLGKIFLIPETDIGKLYTLSENKTAKSITTEKEFMQHKRMQKYALLIGSANKTNAEWEEVARIKGNAILAAQSCKLLPDADASGSVVFNCLTSASNSGVVCALRMTGVFQCEGIFLNKDEKAGVKKLSKSADWNDCVSTLALLRYRKDTRKYDMERLRREVEGSPLEEIYRKAAEEYGAAENLKPENVKLLERSFSAGILKREKYEHNYARILNSPILYSKDKEKALLTQSKDQICAISDLPLKLSQDKISAVELTNVRQAAIQRANETETVALALKNTDLRQLPSYRPLCFSCQSRYVLNMYAKMLNSKESKTHFEVIDVAESEEYDFEPNTNNIFVRGIDEDKENCLLLFLCGEISETKTEAVKNILQSARRAKFHLTSPSVTLNLSAVLPICFSDEQNTKWLKTYCDEIGLCPVTAEELSAAVRDILSDRQKSTGSVKSAFWAKSRTF